MGRRDTDFPTCTKPCPLGATMSHPSKYENKRGLVLPKVYKDFYALCEKHIPANLIGTDLFNNNEGLKKDAVELLAENHLDNFLTEHDFVFMMHQGYMFWYFKAEGIEDPEVYGFTEAEKKIRNFGPLSQFLAGLV